jgi:CheY-like chemotaxis protein
MGIRRLRVLMSAQKPPLNLPNLHGLHLMVVDDDMDALNILVTFLQACGAFVFATATVSGALSYIETARRKMDAVVTDIAMPGTDGVELSQKLRSHPKQPTLPIIALTGFYEDYPNTEVFDAFLKKPVDLDKLASTITSLTRPRETNGPDPDRGG